MMQRISRLLAILVVLAFLVPSMAWGAATADLSPNPMFTAMDVNGDPYTGAKLYTFDTGTTTPKATWTDATKGTANANPIILDSRGQAHVWIDASDGAYRFRLDNADDITVWTVNDIEDASAVMSLAITTYPYDVITQPQNVDKLVLYDDSASKIKELAILDLIGNTYYPDATEFDQGVVGSGISAKALIDAISTDSATLVFRHNSGAATTTYTFSNDETIPSNIDVVIEKGAILSIAGTKTFTINGPFDAGLYQVFSGAGSVVFGDEAVKELYLEWWGGAGDDSTNNSPAFVSAFASMTSPNIQLLEGIYQHEGIAFNIGGPAYTHYLTLKGKSERTTTLKNVGTAVIGLHLDNADHCEISNLSIDQNAIEEDAFYLDGCTHACLHDLFIEGVPSTVRNYGLHMYSCTLSTSERIVLSNNSSSLFVDTTYYATFNDLSMATGNQGTETNSVEIYLNGCVNTVFSSIYAEGGKWRVIYIASCVNTNFYDLQGEWAENLTCAGINIVNSTNVQFWGGRIYQYVATGESFFLIDDSEGVIMDGLLLRRAINSGYRFIKFANNPTNLTFRNLRFENRVSPVDATAVDFDGIYCGAAATQEVTNLVMENLSSAAGTATHTVYTTNARINNIQGNVTTSNGTGSVLLSNITGTVTGLWPGAKDLSPITETVTTTIALSAHKPISLIDTTGGAIANTLGDGNYAGDIKTIRMTADTGDAVLTVAKHRTSSPEVFTFDDAGDSLILMWTGAVWITIENNGCTL